MRYLSFLLFLLVGLIGLPAHSQTAGEVPVGGVLRNVRLNGLTVPPIQLSAFRGKPLIINVWASWCGPCREEMASLDRLARRYRGKQFNLIGISTDDYPERAYVFLEHAGVSFDNYIDDKLELENMLGANKLPLTLLVDAGGRVLAKFYGAKTWDSPAALEVISATLKVKL